MKRFLSAVALCFGLFLVVGISFLLPQVGAQNNVLQELLDLPAPPPPNPLFVGRTNANRGAEFYSKKNQPSEDAPIEDLLEYWSIQSQNYRELGYNIQPSGKVLARILDEIEENPDTLPQLLNILPRTKEIAEFVKKIYDAQMKKENDEENDEENGWNYAVQRWLIYNSKYFSDELLKVANQVADTEDYVSNQDELLALARVDWEKARPIVERLYNDRSQPVSQVLARWAFYIHALEEGSSIDADRYRRELMDIVEDKNAKPGMRDLAMDALVKEKEWDGRDEWYLTLLGDETLAELVVEGRVFTGLTTIIYHSPPERFLEKMLEMLKSDNKTIRNAAVRNLSLLINAQNIEVIRALLPWLSNPSWAKEFNSERAVLVRVLSEVKMQESVPGLIVVLNEKTTVAISSNTSSSNLANYANKFVDDYRKSNTSTYDFRNRTDSVSNSSNESSTVLPTPTPGIPNANTQRTVEVFSISGRSYLALATQRDLRAVPSLRAVLQQVDGWQRGNVIRALLLSGGFSIAEQIEALEHVAKISIEIQNNDSNRVNNSGNYYRGNITISSNSYYYDNKSVDRPLEAADIKMYLGSQLTSLPEPDDALVRALVVRINELDKKDARLANTLRAFIRNWRGTAVNSLLLGDLKNGKTDVSSIVKLLSLRKELREKQINEIFDLRGDNQIANGIAACLLENANDYETILSGESVEAKIAMLGCARLIRAPLPIETVAGYLKHPNKMLALAAERWLEAEDSFEARTAVLGAHPNEAKILGARGFLPNDEFKPSQFTGELFASVNNSIGNIYFYYDYQGAYTPTEKKLKKEVIADTNLLGVYSYNRNFIRIYKDRAVFSWEEDESRYRERTLTAEEFDELKEYLAAQNVDSLKPFLSMCYNCYERQLLMLGRGGGRRVFVKAERAPQFFARLDTIFERMRNQPTRLRYYLEKEVAGLEILFAEENLQARTVWKSGDDLRVLIEDRARKAQIEKELEEADEKAAESVRNREDIDYEKLEQESRKRRQMREFEHLSWQKITGGALAGIVSQPSQMDFIPVRDNFPARATVEQWKARGNNFEIRDGDEDLIKISNGQVTKIADGYYINPIVTGNGRWVVVTKYDSEEGETLLVRINLATRKEYKINNEKYPILRAIAFVPSLNKILVDTSSYYRREWDTGAMGDYELLDAETGAIIPVKGELRPLAQQTSRALQPTGTPDEYWAALPDLENSETQIGIYNSKIFTFKPLLKIPQIRFDSMQMWIDAGKIYFVYEGHLLSLPLPK